jgi:hypothetical protein
MTSITPVAQTMRKILIDVAHKVERESGFVQRASKMGGAEFVQTLSFGWMSNPQATLEELAQTAAAVGVKISPQGLDQRFTEAGARFLKQVLEEAVTELLQGPTPATPILKRFTAVYILDSTVVNLPEELVQAWSGCGSHTPKGQAAVKIEVRLDLSSGQMTGPFLEDGRINDAVSLIQRAALSAGALRMADVGYWSLDEMERIANTGGYWLSRLKSNIHITPEGGASQDILAFLQNLKCTSLEGQVLVGETQKTPARLLVIRVPQEVAAQRRRKLRAYAKRMQRPISPRAMALADWTVLVTNAPESLLSLKEAFILMRSRWQIELLFMLWKSHGQIDEWRSAKSWRILCEVYAKLLAMLMQHWLFLIGFWQFANRSWVKANQTIRKHALHLACTISTLATLVLAIQAISNCLEAGCKINKRKTDLRNFQLLESLSDQVLA